MASLPLHTTPHSNSSSPKTHPQNDPHNRILYKSYFHQISTLCKEIRIQDAVRLLNEMDRHNLRIGPEIYGELLQGCLHDRALSTGQQIHARILKNGDFFSKNEYIETKLLIFYAKCDLPSVCSDLFRRLNKPNVFSWAAMIGLNCRTGSNEEALKGFCQMQLNGMFPDNFIIPNALKACSALQWSQFGKAVHGYALKTGFDSCVFVASSLVDMYGKCGALSDAEKIFGEIPDRNAVTWNSMVVGYVQNGMHEEAVGVFCDMRVEGVEPTRVTLAGFLSATANAEALEEGRQGHAVALVSGLELDNILGTSLINFYSKLGLIGDAEVVFSKMAERDVVAWNLLVSGYVQAGRVSDALRMCLWMRSENLRFDSVTLSSLLSAFADTRNIELGKQAHGYCIRNNLVSDLVVASTIVDMYAKCARINDAKSVFTTAAPKDLVLWNTLIAAYAELGFSGEALKLFYQMQLEGVQPNVVSWNSVIWGFLRIGQVVEAENMFQWMQLSGMKPNSITWTTLISGMSENGYGAESILLFEQMQSSGVRPNAATIIGALSACTKTASLPHGKAIHGYITRRGLFLSPSLSTSLVDMYAKCGSLSLAEKVFATLPNKESPVYNVMVSCYAMHGRATEALALFGQMQEEGVKPDGITFTSVLSACKHAGLVEKGLKVFHEMRYIYHVNPSVEHYGCVVGLLCLCGNLDEALTLIQTMPFDPDGRMLGSVLAACREHDAVELAEYLSKHLFEMEPENSGNYVTLSNAYATAGKWDDVKKLRNAMKVKGIRKKPGYSEVQIGKEVHAFVAGDGSHPRIKEIHEMLAILEREMRSINKY